MTARKRVSLAFEVGTLVRALDGVMLVAEMLENDQLDDDHVPRAAPAVNGMLGLIKSRLAMLDRVLRGREDPGHLWERFNQAVERDSVELPAWTPTERAQHLQEELERLVASLPPRRK